MSNYYVAKSYQDWKQESEPFQANGKMYITLRKPNGATKNVRAYTESEYNRLYGKAECANPVQQAAQTSSSGPNVKNILGFENGYIWIFKGDLDNAEYWFEKTPECRYHVVWGWYIVSTEAIPFDIPSCIQSIELPWEKVGNVDGTLLPKGIIEAAVNELRFGGHPSQYQGSIGDRVDLTLYLTKIVDLPETKYGTSRTFYFEDANANCYNWTTGVKKEWEIGDEIIARAGIKAHDTIKGVRYTILTRLTEAKK